MENIQLPLLWAMLCLYVGAFMLYAFSIWAMKPQIKMSCLLWGKGSSSCICGKNTCDGERTGLYGKNEQFETHT